MSDKSNGSPHQHNHEHDPQTPSVTEPTQIHPTQHEHSRSSLAVEDTPDAPLKRDGASSMTSTIAEATQPNSQPPNTHHATWTRTRCTCWTG